MKEFKTDRKESLHSRWFRFGLNHFPAFRRSSGRVRFISGDWKEIHVRLKRNWRNTNYNGTIYGGSIYAAIDPIYAIQLIQIFGKDYVVWDKKAVIDFKRPIKKKAVAQFIFNDDLIETIRQKLAKKGEYYFDLPVSFVDHTGIIYAEIDKTLFIATKEFYKKKIEMKKLEFLKNQKQADNI
ncbi:MAG: YiiD C-terminal domain-containing protein [Bacteroidales bacterium]|nr:YiiD C-terminal domain-containing protein [Bacteroidales bacterium]